VRNPKKPQTPIFCFHYQVCTFANESLKRTRKRMICYKMSLILQIILNNGGVLRDM
jgi:hypothetical protein